MTSTYNTPALCLTGIIAMVQNGGRLTRDDITALLSLPEGPDLDRLFAVADVTRKRFVGDEVLLRGIIDFSNVCARNCLYCGIRAGNKTLARYRMTEDEIVDTARSIRDAGIATVILQSGEDPGQSTQSLCRVIRRIKEETGMVITLSVGERPFEDYRAFREAGAGRYLLKHETASPRLYRDLHPGMHFKNRLRCLGRLRQLGYEVGSGNLIGLPGQTVRDIAADIIFLRRIGAQMIGIGPFIPHPDTPLSDHRTGEISMVLKCTAVSRLTLPSANIPATTAARILDPGGLGRSLSAGANVVMIDFTPTRYKQYYSIYPQKTNVDNPVEVLDRITASIVSAGRIPA